MRQKKLIANWKMNADYISIKKFVNSFSEIENVEAIVCPSYLGLLPTINFALKKHLKVCAQNASINSLGDHTGSISWAELKDYGVKTVLVGHPDVKKDYGESYHRSNLKLKKFLQNGFKVICFVGEDSLDVSQEISKDALRLQLNQLFNDVSGVDIVDNLYLVYKPTFVTELGTRPNCDFIIGSIKTIRNYFRDKFNFYAGNNLAILYGGELLSEDLEMLCNNENLDGLFIDDERAISGKFMSLVNKYLHNATTEQYLRFYETNILIEEPTEAKRVADQKMVPSFDEYDIEPEVYFKDIAIVEEDV